MTTDRNLSKELLYSNDIDMNGGNDDKKVLIIALFHILTELMNRIEQLEKRLDQQEGVK